MNANSITGKVFAISEPRLYDKNDPSKWSSEVTLDCSEVGRDGKVYPNYPSVEISQNIEQDQLSLLIPGALVTVSYTPQGRYYTNKEGKQSHMNSNRCYKIERAIPTQYQKAANSVAPASVIPQQQMQPEQSQPQQSQPEQSQPQQNQQYQSPFYYPQ